MSKKVFFHKEIEKIDMGKGVIRQDFAEGKNMNVLHWNMSDGSVVGVLDIDSPLLHRFTEADKAGLEAFARILEPAIADI